MKKLLVTVAVLITLSPAFVNTVPIEANGSEDYLVDCSNSDVTLHLPTSTVITKYFMSSPTLRCLTIENDGIESAEGGAFDEMPNLWYLNLQGNRISPSKLFSFGNLASVRKLILSNQKWESYRDHEVIKGIHIHPQLRYLDLKNTGIGSIENTWENPFPELTHLDLSMNKLKNFNFIQPWSANLTHLYLNDTNISQFSLNGYSSLMSLVLDNNNIKSIGDTGMDLISLTNLRNLSLSNNQIESIRDGAFRDTVSLQYLDISKNFLSTIYPGTLEDLHSLQVLLLDQNFFEDVYIAVPLNITTLSMNSNHIKHLMINSLYNLSQLKTLSLTDNIITDIHTEAFQNQEMLEELYLNNNELSYLPNEWCQPMKNLRYLDLSGNKFTVFESMIHCSAPSLQQIHVKHNPLAFINASTFATLPKSVSVYLENTRIVPM